MTIWNSSSSTRVTVKSHSIPPRAVEHLRVGDRADVARDAVVAQPLEQLGGARPGDLELGERRLVEQRRRLAAGRVLGADRRRPVHPGPAARAQRLVAGGARWTRTS